MIFWILKGGKGDIFSLGEMEEGLIYKMKHSRNGMDVGVVFRGVGREEDGTPLPWHAHTHSQPNDTFSEWAVPWKYTRLWMEKRGDLLAWGTSQSYG